MFKVTMAVSLLLVSAAAAASTGSEIKMDGKRSLASEHSLVRFDAKSSHVDAGLVYEYTGNRVVENRVRSVRELVMISAPPDCPLTVNCARAGQYQIRKNVVETLASFRDIVTEVGPIDGPNLNIENCIADPACP